MLGALRDDALTSTADGFALRLSLPWIRSLPLTSLVDVALSVDGRDRPALRIRLGERIVDLPALADETGWWFVQDRVVLLGDHRLGPGDHDVTLSFALVIPYLQVGPDGPLTLPFRVARTLRLDAASLPTVSRDAA